MSSMPPSPSSTPVGQSTDVLPPLSPAEYRVYDKMAQVMNQYHDHFRMEWKQLYDAAAAGSRPAGMSLRQYINAGQSFYSHLDLHHNIEERYIFPILAKKMDCFKDELGHDGFISQHHQIFEGLNVWHEYLQACKRGETELQMSELKRLMDVFGTILLKHLDEEVKNLRAENMRKYWSIDEMKSMPL